MNIKEAAQAYEPKQTLNIADLDSVDTNLELEDREGKDKDGEVFQFKIATVGGKEYRVPGKVIGDLKAILEQNPNLQKFKVTKAGIGMNTQYTVIPLS